MHYRDPYVKLIVQALKLQKELPEWVPTIPTDVQLDHLFHKCHGDTMVKIYTGVLHMRDTHTQDPDVQLDDEDVKRLNHIIDLLSTRSVNVRYFIEHGMLNHEEIIWRGTTWPHAIWSWLCCSTNRWLVTNKRIDLRSGCCGTSSESIDVRRITDIRYHQTCGQFLVCRGSLIVVVSEEQQREYRISTWGMHQVYESLRLAWLAANNNVAVTTTPETIGNN